MPFTLFHIGPALLIYSIFLFFDPVALIIGAVILDVEPIAKIFLGWGTVVHGPLHSFLGVFLSLPITLLFTWLCWRVYAMFQSKFDFRLRSTSWKVSIVSGLLGSYSHIILDAFIYPDLNLAWPIAHSNQLLYKFPSFSVYNLTLACFLIAIPLIILRKYR